MRLFVYGTLKRGGSNHAQLAGQKFLGEARTAHGYTLYSLGSYPGLIADATDREGVIGEVWQVTPIALARLDAFEGLPEGLYTRGPVSLLTPFANEKVETYFYARPLAGAKKLGSLWLE